MKTKNFSFDKFPALNGQKKTREPKVYSYVKGREKSSLES